MDILDNLTTSLHELSQYLFDPSKRIYFIYLLSSFVLAIPVFYKLNQSKNVKSFFAFLFPQKVWLAHSARQDYILWVINKIIRGLLWLPIILTMVPIAIGFSDFLEYCFGAIQPVSQSKTLVMICFTVLLFVFDDFTRFLLHWLLHKVPFLWEIHKVHHSAKVLTPFTIYRSHPIESYFYACRMALSQGLATGLAYYLFGVTLSVFDIVGANIFVFIFNVMGSNLRHSHIWLSWGDKLESWFISPAQHQIHHNDKKEHFDRNLGSALAVWDRMFGTLIKASTTSSDQLTFGVGNNFKEHDSLWGIYWRPVKASCQRLISRKRK